MESAFFDEQVDESFEHGLVHPLSGFLLAMEQLGLAIAPETATQLAHKWNELPSTKKHVIAQVLAQTLKMTTTPTSGLELTGDVAAFLSCRITPKTSTQRCPSPADLEKLGCSSVECYGLHGCQIKFINGVAACNAFGDIMTVSGDCGPLVSCGITGDCIEVKGALSVVALTTIRAILGLSKIKKAATGLAAQFRDFGLKFAQKTGLSDASDLATIAETQPKYLDDKDLDYMRRILARGIASLDSKPVPDALKELAPIPMITPYQEPLGCQAHFHQRLCAELAGEAQVLTSGPIKTLRLGNNQLDCVGVTTKLDSGNIPPQFMDDLLRTFDANTQVVCLVLPKGGQEKHHLALKRILNAARVLACRMKVEPALAAFLYEAQQTHRITFVRGPSDRADEIGVVFTRGATDDKQLLTAEWNVFINKYLMKDVLDSQKHALTLMLQYQSYESIEMNGAKWAESLRGKKGLRFPLRKKQTWGPNDARFSAYKVCEYFNFGSTFLPLGCDVDVEYLDEPDEDDKPVHDVHVPEALMMVEENEAEAVLDPKTGQVITNASQAVHDGDQSLETPQVSVLVEDRKPRGVMNFAVAASPDDGGAAGPSRGTPSPAGRGRARYVTTAVGLPKTPSGRGTKNVGQQ